MYPGKMKMQRRSQPNLATKKKSVPMIQRIFATPRTVRILYLLAHSFSPPPPRFSFSWLSFFSSFFSSLFSSENQKATAVIFNSTFVQRLLFWWIDSLSFVILGHSCSSFDTFMSIGRRDQQQTSSDKHFGLCCCPSNPHNRIHNRIR